jgi:hypothetical protein
MQCSGSRKGAKVGKALSRFEAVAVVVCNALDALFEGFLAKNS